MSPTVRTPAVLGVVSLSVLSVAVPAFLVVSVPDVGRSAGWVLTMLVMIWSGIRLSLLVTRGRAHLFDMFFWLFCYIFLGLAPTAQIRADLISETTPGMDPSLDLPTALVVVLGIGCYEVGRLVATRPRDRRAADPTRPATPPGRVSGSRTMILLAVAALVTVYYIASVGFAFLQPTRDAGTIAREAAFADPAVRAILLAASLIPVLIALGALLQLRAAVMDAAVRRWLVVVSLLCVLLIFSVVSPTSSARYTFGTVIFALATYAGALKTPYRVRATMVATFLGLLFVFPLADAFRRAGQDEVGRGGGFFSEYLSNADYDSFWQIANAYAYAQDGLVEPLRQFLGSALFWVPRSVWASKPTDTGVELANYRGYSFDNLSAPLWAEALVNGGIIAVVFTFLVAGYVTLRLDHRIAPAFTGGGVWLIVGAIFPVYTTILLRGSLLQATGAFAVAVVCVVFVRGRPPAPAARPEPGPVGAAGDRSAHREPQASYSDSS